MTGTGQAALAAPSNRHPLRALLICAVGMVLVAAAPFAEHRTIYALVATLAFLVIAPAWISWQRGRLDVFEAVHVIGLVYFLYFGLGTIWTISNPFEVAYDAFIVPYLAQALVYVIVGYLALLVGYYGPWWKHTATARREQRVRGANLLLVPGVVGLLGFFTVRINEQLSALRLNVGIVTSTLTQLAPLFIYVWALTWLLWFSGRLTRKQRWVALGLMVPGALATAWWTVNNKSLIMTIALVPVIGLWYAQRRIPWTFIGALLLVMVFVIFPFYNTYRGTDVRLNQQTRMEMTYRQAQDWDFDQYMDRSWGTVKRRLAMINSVAIVVRDVGRFVPYAHGKTLIPPLALFIPRAIWPDKPTLQGRYFADAFKVTSIFDRETYFAATVVGELLWNFDLPGVLIGMFLLGLLMRFLHRRYAEGALLNPVLRAVYVVALFQLLNLDGTPSASAVNLVRTLIVLEVMFWLARRVGWLETPPDAAPVVRPA